MGLRYWLAKKLAGREHAIIKITDTDAQSVIHKTLLALSNEQKIALETLMHDSEHIYEFLNKKFRNAERNRREPLSAYVKAVILYLEQQHDREFEIFVNLYTSDEDEKQSMFAYWRTIVADRSTNKGKVD